MSVVFVGARAFSFHSQHIWNFDANNLGVAPGDSIYWAAFTDTAFDYVDAAWTQRVASSGYDVLGTNSLGLYAPQNRKMCAGKLTAGGATNTMSLDWRTTSDGSAYPYTVASKSGTVMIGVYRYEKPNYPFPGNPGFAANYFTAFDALETTYNIRGFEYGDGLSAVMGYAEDSVENHRRAAFIGGDSNSFPAAIFTKLTASDRLRLESQDIDRMCLLDWATGAATASLAHGVSTGRGGLKDRRHISFIVEWDGFHESGLDNGSGVLPLNSATAQSTATCSLVAIAPLVPGSCAAQSTTSLSLSTPPSTAGQMTPTVAACQSTTSLILDTPDGVMRLNSATGVATTSLSLAATGIMTPGVAACQSAAFLGLSIPAIPEDATRRPPSGFARFQQKRGGTASFPTTPRGGA